MRKNFFWVDISDSLFSFLILIKPHKHFTHHSATFLSLFYHLLVCINPTILMDAIQHVTTLCLSAFLMLCAVHNHCATQEACHQNAKVLRSQNVSSLNTTFPVALRNDQEHLPKAMDYFLLPRCTFLG